MNGRLESKTLEMIFGAMTVRYSPASQPGMIRFLKFLNRQLTEQVYDRILQYAFWHELSRSQFYIF
jgi:hypothetical protein